MSSLLLRTLMSLGAVCAGAQDPTRTLRPQQEVQAISENRPIYSLMVGTDLSMPMKPGLSRQDVQSAASESTRQQALEKARAYLLAQSGPMDGELQAALASATIVPIREPSTKWEGDTYHVRTSWEIRFQPQFSGFFARRMSDNGGLLGASLWTSRKSYRQGEDIQVFMKGNHPFHARVLYRDAQGKLLQILPNPHRTVSTFPAAEIIAIPGGADRYKVTVTPPFGEEQIIFFASTAPLGDLRLKDRGAVYDVQGTLEDIARITRGIRMEAFPPEDIVEFVEYRVTVITTK